jgi:hypothetical protein
MIVRTFQEIAASQVAPRNDNNGLPPLACHNENCWPVTHDLQYQPSKMAGDQIAESSMAMD